VKTPATKTNALNFHIAHDLKSWAMWKWLVTTTMEKEVVDEDNSHI
jgi:hypothetical protein